ncbi:MAG TPA: hypothetical protein VI522_00275, partial [Gammaproteobacteria bacterium]|nr:hypothetical protein [Gammaproteobacteria bacterium]
MKLASSFKPGELAASLIISFAIPVLISIFAAGLLYEAAQWLWAPFLLIFLVLALRYHQSLFITPEQTPARHKTITVLKLMGAFFLIVLCYLGFGQGLWLYQSPTYDETGQAFFIEVALYLELIWAIKLALITWIIAAALALAMAAYHTSKISEFMGAFTKHNPQYGLMIDSIIIFSFSISLFMFFVLGATELSRTITALFNFQRPVFPELTALLTTLVLITGYFFLKIKTRGLELAKKPVSLGRVMLSQLGPLTLLLVLAQGMIVFFPIDWVAPLLKPVKNVFAEIAYTQTWVSITLACAIITAPILARYLARS